MLEDVLAELIDRKCEGRGLDYKGPMVFGELRAEQADLLKDIMAFANTQDGGYIVIGVAEADGWSPIGMDARQASSFDITKIGDSLKKHCSRMPSFTASQVKLDGKTFVLLNIQQFDDEPVVCIKDLHDSKSRAVLREGAVYMRTGHATSEAVRTAEDMRRLIETAVQRRGESITRQIRALLGPLPDNTSSPGTASTDEYQAEEDQASAYFEQNNISLPYWQLAIRPGQYAAERVAELSELRQLRRAAEVTIRGWNFPHADRDSDCNFEAGIQSFTHWNTHHEVHRAYRSGLFITRKQPWEMFTEGYEGKLSYLSAIWTLTEFSLFAARYTNGLIPDDAVVMSVSLGGFNGWQLVEPSLSMPHNAVAKVGRFEVQSELPTAQLVADHEAIAVNWSRRLFELFNADIAAGTITDWQTKFVNRQF